MWFRFSMSDMAIYHSTRFGRTTNLWMADDPGVNPVALQ
jgi:hypothetical protein